MKYFKEIYLSVLTLGLIVSVSYNLKLSSDKQELENIVVAQQIVLKEANKYISYLEKKKSSVITCANNQEDYINALINMENKYNMPKGILQNIAYHESRYNPNAVSHAGAVGIMQIHPKWHKTVNPYNPYESIKYGAKYLDSLYKRFGSWDMALAAWNWGQGNLSKYTYHKAPLETRNFVKNVMTGVVV